MPVRTLLFTDVVDSTLLVGRWGDVRAAAVWAEHDCGARELIAAHHGREIDRTDGFFLLFADVRDAARFALAYHAALAGLALLARVGLHVGEVTLRRNARAAVGRGAKPVEVEGLAKPIAARLMALARGGQTLLSAGSRAALGAAPLDGAALESHGHYRLKGLDAPIEVFELGARDTAAFAPPPDADKAYRVVPAGALWLPLREVRHNLPAERDAFVGRSAELRRLAQRLDAGARWLTVLGVGGTGKTRFVTRYGWAWLGDWPGGVHFCDLSAARSLDGVVSAVAVGLGVPLGKGDPALQLAHAIAARGRCLLILDNFEQVVPHAAATLGCWLDRAAEACFVVTSRERLQLPGEELFPIEPLPVATEAIELFEVRARAQRPGFAVDAANRAAVAEVVRLLDGLPLAIELAAARVGVLSPPQLVDRLRDRFQLLAGSRGHAARQATLRAAIDWSWDLLTTWEQDALAQCSVFDGGFTLPAAEAVLDLSRWPGAPPPIDAVQALVDKSLLRSWVRSEADRFAIDEPYFGMYLSIRDYALAKLGRMAPGAGRAAEERHGRYFATFGAVEAIDELSREGGVRRRRALALELDNLVSACRRAVQRGDADAALAAGGAAWEVLDMQGPFAAGVALAEQVLTLDLPTARQRAQALYLHARAARRAGRGEGSEAWLEQALALCRDCGERRAEAGALGALGLLHHDRGETGPARAFYVEALAIHRAIGNRIGEGVVLGNLGNLHGDRCEAEAAREHYAAALAVDREVGNRRAEGMVLGNLGTLHYEQGRSQEALACYRQACEIHREVGNLSVEGSVLGNIGGLQYDLGLLADAQQGFEQSLAIHRAVGNRRFEGVVLSNLGVLLKDQGRLPEALAHYQQALAIHRQTGDRRFEALALANIGSLLLDQDRPDAALQMFDAGLAAAREVGNRRLEGAILGGQGDLLARQGRVDDARATLTTAETMLRGIDERLELAKLLCVRGRLDHACGEPAHARAALAEAEALALMLGSGPDSEVRRAIATLQAQIGRPASTLPVDSP